MKIKYTDEPKDGLEFPESAYEVLSSSTVSKKWRELSVSGEGYDKLQKGEKIQLVPTRGGAPGRGLVGGAPAMCGYSFPYLLPHARR